MRKMATPVRILNIREKSKCGEMHVVDTTPNSKDWGRELSPSILGPVPLYDEYVAQTVENAWQYSKVYKEFTNEHLHPTDEYFVWANNGWESDLANRFPVGRKRVPLYSIWEGEKLDSIEARKTIYAPVYSKAVVHTEAFDRLLTMYEKGERFVLLDTDGYDYLAMNLTLQDVMEDPERTMGHAFVLAMLLENPALRKKYGGTR